MIDETINKTGLNSGKRRFGVRAVSLLVLCIAVIASLSAVPYMQFNRERAAVHWLITNQVDFEARWPRVKWGARQFGGKDFMVVPSWLLPFTTAFSELPPDRDVYQIVFYDSSRIDCVHQSGLSLPGVDRMFFEGPLDTKTLNKIDEMLSQFPNLRSLTFIDVEAGRLAKIVEHHPIEELYLAFDSNGIPTVDQLRGIQTLAPVKSIQVSIGSATDQDLEALLSCSNIEVLTVEKPTMVSDAMHEKLERSIRYLHVYRNTRH